MYNKLFLDPVQSEMIYKEPIVIEKPGRIILKTARRFQEILGAVDYQEGRAISKGHTVEVNLDFPSYVPMSNPPQNWFQVALFTERNSILADPLNCSARYKGALPGRLLIQEPIEFAFEDVSIKEDPKVKTQEPYPATFVFEDDPHHVVVDYMLFIYDSADYQLFLEGVHNLLGGYLNRGKAVVADNRGNKVLVSDEDKQPMLLIPISLLIGGLEYIYNAWDRILNGV